jgi:hypothetical protein
VVTKRPIKYPTKCETKAKQRKRQTCLRQKHYGTAGEEAEAEREGIPADGISGEGRGNVLRKIVLRRFGSVNNCTSSAGAAGYGQAKREVIVWHSECERRVNGKNHSEAAPAEPVTGRGRKRVSK